MLTKLDAINSMIVSAGSRPLLASQSRHPLYMKAEFILNRVTSAVMSLGLWFNTEYREVIAQEDGTVNVPHNCLKADPLGANYNLTIRGGKIYDLNTGAWWEGGNLWLRMYMNFEFEEIERVAQEYIVARAVYEYYLDDNGADPKLTHYRNERDNAWVLLWRDHIRSRRTNAFDTVHTTANQLRRGVQQPIRNRIGRLM